jgi:GTP cyclohydrolase IV
LKPAAVVEGVKDVHAMVPRSGLLTLQHVGIAGIVKPLAIQRPERVVTVTARFCVGVDLPAQRKGSDLSRNAELLADVVDETLVHPVESLEGACALVAAELLQRHTYATRAEVEANAEYLRVRGIVPEHRSYEEFLLLAEARGGRRPDGTLSIDRTIGAEVVGMTACPCAMETAREMLTKEFPLLNDPSMASFPIVSHNQRNRTRVLFDLPEGTTVEAEAILDAIEAAQSSPTYAILKRRDEAQVVLNAHRNPKFVEDVLRDLLLGLPARFPHLPDTLTVRVHTTSEESIHKYDVVAFHQATLGELRARATP